jgi:hypothetical protein
VEAAARLGVARPGRPAPARRLALAVGIASLCGSGGSARAQTAPDAHPAGARIRLRAPDVGVIRTTGAVVASETINCRGAECAPENALIGFVIMSPFIAGTGAAIGFSLPVERWRPIALPSR